MKERGSKLSVKSIDERLERNEWLAGEVYTASAVVNVFGPKTMSSMKYALEPCSKGFAVVGQGG